ncbi:MAG: hypothetical protein QXI58_00785 [Candidatus Micrarchaeia archaeon]
MKANKYLKCQKCKKDVLFRLKNFYLLIDKGTIIPKADIVGRCDCGEKTFKNTTEILKYYLKEIKYIDKNNYKEVAF